MADKDHEHTADAPNEAGRRTFLIKAAYTAPALLALGALANPVNAQASSRPPPPPFDSQAEDPLLEEALESQQSKGG